MKEFLYKYLGQKVSHKKFGKGIILSDTYNLCRKDECFVKFDKPISFQQKEGINCPIYSDMFSFSELKLCRN